MQKTPLLLIKDFLENLKTCKNMVIVFTEHPSVCLEYRNNRYYINMTYITTEGYNFVDVDKFYIAIVKYCYGRRTILRIELNSIRSTAILYGPLYQYELQYSKQNNRLGYVIDW